MKDFLVYLPLILFFGYIFCGVSVMMYANKKDKKQLDVDLGAVSKFIAFMTIITFARLCLMDLGIVNPENLNIRMGWLLIVFLEDAFYAMIPYYICKKLNNKYLKFGVWAIFSLLFAQGHLYQGVFFAIITLFYPYFISRRFAMKTSFATVMACHFIYDAMTLSTLKLAKLFSYVL